MKPSSASCNLSPIRPANVFAGVSLCFRSQRFDSGGAGSVSEVSWALLITLSPYSGPVLWHVEILTGCCELAMAISTPLLPRSDGRVASEVNGKVATNVYEATGPTGWERPVRIEA